MDTTIYPKKSAKTPMVYHGLSYFPHIFWTFAMNIFDFCQVISLDGCDLFPKRTTNATGQHWPIEIMGKWWKMIGKCVPWICPTMEVWSCLDSWFKTVMVVSCQGSGIDNKTIVWNYIYIYIILLYYTKFLKIVSMINNAEQSCIAIRRILKLLPTC